MYFHWKRRKGAGSGSFQERAQEQFIFLLQTLSSKGSTNGTIFQWTSEHKDEQLYMLTEELMFNVSVRDGDIGFSYSSWSRQ